MNVWRQIACRGIAWRCADSISLREFLGYGLSNNPPDHSSVSRPRRRLSLEAREAMFAWVLERLRAEGLLSDTTLGVDSTTLEARAARRSIVRRADGSGYEEWLEELARSSGIDTPTRSDLAQRDRQAPEEGFQRGRGASGSPRGADHEDEGRPRAPGAQAGAGLRHGQSPIRRQYSHINLIVGLSDYANWDLFPSLSTGQYANGCRENITEHMFGCDQVLAIVQLNGETRSKRFRCPYLKCLLVYVCGQRFNKLLAYLTALHADSCSTTNRLRPNGARRLLRRIPN